MTASWPISRTRPVGLHYGVAIPVFIHNGSYHLSSVKVFSDGAIDAWGFVDRELFDGKLRSGWVCPQPPAHSVLSVFNLGSIQTRQCTWTCTPDDVRAAVHEAVRALNPAMDGLIDMQGSDSELRGGVRHAKLLLGDDHPYRRHDGQDIPGRSLPVIVQEREQYQLTRIFVFADSTARLGAEGTLVSIDSIPEMFHKRLLRTRVPDGAALEVEGLGSVECGRGSWFVKPGQRVREIMDLVPELSGTPSRIDQCCKAFEAYEAEPTESRRAALRESYLAVPVHLRSYCGDMDSKDYPIRRALGMR